MGNRSAGERREGRVRLIARALAAVLLFRVWDDGPLSRVGEFWRRARY